MLHFSEYPLLEGHSFTRLMGRFIACHLFSLGSHHPLLLSYTCFSFYLLLPFSAWLSSLVTHTYTYCKLTHTLLCLSSMCAKHRDNETQLTPSPPKWCLVTCLCSLTEQQERYAHTHQLWAVVKTVSQSRFKLRPKISLSVYQVLNISPIMWKCFVFLIYTPEWCGAHFSLMTDKQIVIAHLNHKLTHAHKKWKTVHTAHLII